MKNIIFILLVFSIQTAFKPFPGGAEDYAPAIRKQAEDMGKALVKKNYRVYIKYTDPRVVQEMGGEAAFADTLKHYEAQWQRYNMSVYDINVEDPSTVVDSAGELQTSIPVTMQMRVKGGIVTTITTFIGISKDQGKNWVFMDSGADYHNLRKKYADLSSKLIVPAPTQPVFKAD